MDLRKNVVDCFGVFLKNVQKHSDSSTDFDLWKVLELSPLQSLPSTEELQSLETLISQLQTIKDELTKCKSESSKEQDVTDSEDGKGMQEKHTPVLESSSSQSKLLVDDCAPRATTTLTDVNPNIVQIKASNDEIERRISAFIEKKQREVNQLNNREFCSVLTPEMDTGFSCARTDAVFVARAGCKSHIKISRVVNPYGPQTRPSPEARSRLYVAKQSHQSVSTGLEERLKNIESHLQLQLPGLSKSDLYGRLKTLEDRILFLEGLSPEYFQNVPPPKRQKKVEETAEKEDPMQDLSLQEIDERIQSLQASLQMKQPISSWGY